jgi:hypothetical protein
MAGNPFLNASSNSFANSTTGTSASSGAQNDLFSNAPACSYAGIQIPVHSFQIYSGSQVAWHKYPYQPGADAEFTGREQLTGQIVAPFFVGMVAEASDVPLWPGSVSLLREAAQAQKSQKLVLPAGLGTIDNAVIKVNESYTAEARDGAMVTIQFWEDNAVALSSLPTPLAMSQLPQAASNADALSKLSALAIPPLFTDQNGNIINSFRTAVDTIQSNLTVFQNSLTVPLLQIQSLTGSVTNLLQTTNSLKSPGNWQLYQTLVQIVDNLRQARDEVLNTKSIAVFVTKADTNIISISRSTKTTPADLMKLNNVPDWNVVAAATFINYYTTSGLAA